MQIDYNILIAYGGTAKKLDKGSVIFREGNMPHYFYQLVEGEVKVSSTNSEGRELIQGIFKSGESFGEPPLLLGKPYPSMAQTNAPSVVIRIPKDQLLSILKDYPEIANRMLYAFAERIYSKALSVQVWVSHTPEEKISSFFGKIKEKDNCKSPMLIPYTRQQIADFTGLRVETVIRTLSRMNEEGKVNIVSRKVYY